MEEGIKEQATTATSEVGDQSLADTTSEESKELNDVDSIAEAFSNTEGIQEQAGDNEPLQSEGQEEQPDGESQDFPSPEGFSAEVWGSVPEEARAIIQQREEAHAKALSQERARVSDSLAQTQNWAQNANEQLLTTLATLQQVTEAEFGGIDWNTLASSDPAQYVQLQQQYIQRINAVKQIQNNVAQLAKQHGDRMKAEYQYHLSQEASQTLPRIKAIMGNGYSENSYVDELVTYLKENGVPDKAISSMRYGYEAELATKAMLYDRMQKARLSAQQKISEAPRVSAPKGASTASGEASARLAKAKAFLSKNNNNTEALASVFEAL